MEKVETEIKLKLIVYGPHNRTPEEYLWLAVLLDAVDGVSKGRRDDKLWIASDDDEVGCFRWVCEVLGVDQTWIREMLASNWLNKNKAAYWRRIVLDRAEMKGGSR